MMDKDTQKRSAELTSEIDALESAIRRIEKKKTILVVTEADKVAYPFSSIQHEKFSDSFTNVLELELNRLQAELEAL